jgi:putative transposase
MRFLKLNADQVVSLLGEVQQKVPRAVLARKYGISPTSISNWRRYRGLDAAWLVRFRTLELRVQQLTRSVQKSQAQVAAAARVIRQLEPSPKRRSLFAAATQAYSGLCRNRCNAAMGLSLATIPPTKIKSRDDALIKEMRRFVSANPGMGFSNLFHVLLQDRGCTRNHARDLYEAARLQIKRRAKTVPTPARVRKRHHILGKRDAMWAIDYMSHRLVPRGTRFYVLNCVDEYTRECVFSIAFRQFGAAPTIRALEAALSRGRKPQALRSDNGREFTSDLISAWFHRRHIGRVLNRPGHPEENVIVERFNGTLRREVLNWYTFKRFEDVQAVLDDYRARYNIGRPHVSLGGLSPLQFAYVASTRPAVALSAHTPGTRLPVAKRQRLARLAPEVAF